MVTPVLYVEIILYCDMLRQGSHNNAQIYNLLLTDNVDHQQVGGNLHPILSISLVS